MLASERRRWMQAELRESGRRAVVRAEHSGAQPAILRRPRHAESKDSQRHGRRCGAGVDSRKPSEQQPPGLDTGECMRREAARAAAAERGRFHGAWTRSAQRNIPGQRVRQRTGRGAQSVATAAACATVQSPTTATRNHCAATAATWCRDEEQKRDTSRVQPHQLAA